MRVRRGEVTFALGLVALAAAVLSVLTHNRMLALVVVFVGLTFFGLSIRDSLRIRRHLSGRAPMTHCPMCGKAMSDGQEATLQHMVDVHNARVETRPVDCDDPTHDHYGKHIALIRMPMPPGPAEPAKQWTEDDL